MDTGQATTRQFNERSRGVNSTGQCRVDDASESEAFAAVAFLVEMNIVLKDTIEIALSTRIANVLRCKWLDATGFLPLRLERGPIQSPIGATRRRVLL